jgi:hypothetical protein
MKRGVTALLEQYRGQPVRIEFIRVFPYITRDTRLTPIEACGYGLM